MYGMAMDLKSSIAQTRQTRRNEQQTIRKDAHRMTALYDICIFSNVGGRRQQRQMNRNEEPMDEDVVQEHQP